MSNRKGHARNGLQEPICRFVIALTLPLTAVFLVARLPLLFIRVFDPDEFEHAHVTWCLDRGLIPYVDFFEHHTPGYYWFLLPFMQLFDVAGSADDAFRFLFFVRLLSGLLTALSIGLVVWLGFTWSRAALGFTAAALLGAVPMFLEKTLEARPDVLALPLWLVCFGLLARVIQKEPPQALHYNKRALLISGLCLGAATMCTQKMLFTFPGLGLAFLAWWWWFRKVSEARHMGLALSWFSLGVALPVVAVWLWFAVRGAGGGFVEHNFFLNARWKARSPPNQYLVQLWSQSWPVCLLATCGLVATWQDVRKKARWDAFAIMAFASLAGLFLGLWVIPVAMRQYYLMVIPILALVASRGLLALCCRLPGLWSAGCIAFVLIAIHVPAARHLAHSFESRNHEQLRTLRFVMENTSPPEPVLDGWRGMGVFRPHAFFYFMLHHEVRAMIPEQTWGTFVHDLESGHVRPGAIVMDENLSEFEQRMRFWLDEHYVWVPSHEVYLRRTNQSIPPQ